MRGLAFGVSKNSAVNIAVECVNNGVSDNFVFAVSYGNAECACCVIRNAYKVKSRTGEGESDGGPGCTCAAAEL